MQRPPGISKITINGEEYWPRPHEVNPEYAEDLVWTQFPPNDLFIEDPEWYDAMGEDMIMQRRIWAISDEAGQIDAFKQLLADFPNHALDMMFSAAVKGKPHVIRFLLEQGVRATANEAEGDDKTLVPFHAAAAQGHVSCVRIFVEEAKLPPDTLDELGGTPLMRACFKKRPDIVRYLLEKGANISTRQTAEDGEQGTNAFEFAAGSGCVECAKALLAQARELNIDTTTWATPVALEAAAQSGELEMLDLVLELGKYPRPAPDGSWNRDVSLTESMKDAIEAAFSRALKQGTWVAYKPLFAYINSRKADGSYNWTSLRGSTVNDLFHGILSSAEKDDQENQEVFIFLADIFLGLDSRLSSPEVLDSRDEFLGDIFFWASRQGSLKMMRLISGRYGEVDINHLSRRVAPLLSSSLYMAAGGGHDAVVDYLLFEHPGEPAMHLGNGMFANGPTAIWIAIWNGHVKITETLLCHGGPVTYIDSAITTTNTAMQVVATAAKALRSPVKLYSEAEWTRMHGSLDSSSNQGEAKDIEGNEMKYLVLPVSEDKLQQWNGIQLRKSDEQLLAIEKQGRTCKAAA
jgi:ankyrin repeat protein